MKNPFVYLGCVENACFIFENRVIKINNNKYIYRKCQKIFNIIHIKKEGVGLPLRLSASVL